MVKTVELVKPWAEVSGVCVITTMPGDHTPIHVDGDGTKKCGYGLNIPVFNCEDCYTVVYDTINNAIHDYEYNNALIQTNNLIPLISIYNSVPYLENFKNIELLNN